MRCAIIGKVGTDGMGFSIHIQCQLLLGSNTSESGGLEDIFIFQSI